MLLAAGSTRHIEALSDGKIPHWMQVTAAMVISISYTIVIFSWLVTTLIVMLSCWCLGSVFHGAAVLL